MKFTVGQWVVRSGYSVLNAAQVFDSKFENGELTVYAYSRPVAGRNQVIDQGSMTFHFTSDQNDTIHVRAAHYEGIRKRKPDFEIERGSTNPQFKENEDSLEYTSGKLKAVIKKNPCSLEYYYDGKKLTESVPRALANISDVDGKVFMREQLTLDVGECVYGLGEQFTPFVKNGQNVEMWNEDGGTASNISYKNVPFYLTSKNYGVFVTSSDKVSYEIASEQVERVQFSVPGQQIEYIVIGGESTKDVIRNYTSLTGRPALPPAWSFGLWLSTSFTTNYDEKTVNSFIDGMRDRNLPLHVFHFDSFWMKECEWCNFEWDPATFPDPKGMLHRLHERGLKICVWINPYIAQKSPLFKEAMDNHYLLEKPNGDVWQWDRWQAGMGIVDFTNPDAYKWYQGKLKILLDMGVDCFKTDFGERIPTDAVYYSKADPESMHNFYTYLYNKCVFNLLEREKGKGNAVLFARSATAGGQKFPVHWGGDCWGTYVSMAECLRGGLSLCMSGFGFWSHDIGGFEQAAPADLYKRWVAFGLLSSHSRLHGSTSYRVPWVFDEESVDVLRHFTNLKCSLMPYLWKQANITAEYGYPMMRSMVLEFSDPVSRYLDTQYMLGDSLLVAPIFNTDGVSDFYLPNGRWSEWFSGTLTEGGRYYEKKYDYFGIPLYQRENTIVAVGKSISEVDYDYMDDVTLRVAYICDGGKASCEIISADGKSKAEVSVSRSGKKFSFNVKGLKKYNVELCGLKEKPSCDLPVRPKKDGDCTSFIVTPGEELKSFTVEAEYVL